MLEPLGPTLWRRVCGRVTMMRTGMQPVQKLAEPHSVASNGANAINDAHIINHDEEHGADLAPTDDLYGVLRTIGVDVVPWCINTGKSLIPLTLRFLAQKRNLLIPLELSRVMHQGRYWAVSFATMRPGLSWADY